MAKPRSAASQEQALRTAKILVGLIWLGIITLCLLHRDSFTLEGILTYTPEKPLLAALVLLALFAVKSLSVFLYSGFLYIAAGVLFPLPAAIAVNLLGTAVMVTLPYLLGRKLGGQAVEYILRRWPKASALRDLRSGSDFFFVLIIRLLNVFSLDAVSAYMGAVGVSYRSYLPASLLGLASMCVLFPIMGGSLSDVRSPQFLVSAGIQLAIMLVSCTVFYFRQKQKTSLMRKDSKL